MRDRNPSPSSGLANFLTLVGFALLVAGGVSAYPSARGWLGLEVVPEGFGDEAALSASIVEANESLPSGVSGRSASPDASTADPAPLVLPETPLQSEVTPAPDAIEPTPEPTRPADPAPLATPVETAQPATEFVPSVPTRLAIPAIGLDAPVVTVGWSAVTQNGQQVSMWDVPNWRAAGWLKTTARVGEPGNTVLDGHHNVYGEVFRYLVDLEPGDTIQLWAGDRARDYIVSLMKILPEKGQPIEVRLENAKWIQPTEDERLTLVTCWPYENNTHRLIVVALPADAPPSATEAE
ncbi:MAG: sortase domain-containing protein [Anaerolineae bacterium]